MSNNSSSQKASTMIKKLNCNHNTITNWNRKSSSSHEKAAFYQFVEENRKNLNLHIIKSHIENEWNVKNEL